MNRTDLKKEFQRRREATLAEWRELLSIPSISADPAYRADCLRCAGWLEAQLSAIGFSVERWESDTLPVVFAQLNGDGSKPVVLFYGHYDVQPADPLESWASPPFSPEIRNGRMYARGAEDNKGQLFYFLKAVQALRDAGVTLPTIKILLEGEEECGGKALADGLAGWSPRLKADLLMVCDTGMVKHGAPTITMGLRGIATLELFLRGANHDLHSGVFGGVAPNPAAGIARLVASLHHEDGSIAVAGFYDDVVDPDPADLERIKALPLEPAELSALVGVDLVGGERDRNIWERGGVRPTLEVNGIGSGYQGAGSKTIIPSSAMVKLSFRLVHNQDPKRIIECVKDHVLRHTPRGLRAEFGNSAAAGGALSLSGSSQFIARAATVLEETFGRKPAYHWNGASIPVIPDLARAAGNAEPILVGFGLEEDMIHAPNESFSIEQFEQGFLYVASYLQRL
jgi:acetylornithine deacetylase/succinyl-diaminopimelate desuccinylase-like protein